MILGFLRAKQGLCHFDIWVGGGGGLQRFFSFFKIAIQGYGVPYLVKIPSDSWGESFIDRR